MTKKQSRIPQLRNKTDGVSNQYVSNPRQERFLKYYFDPSASDTFGNVFQSALAAGYSETYARVMTTPALNLQWLRTNDRTSLTETHIVGLIENLARQANRESDQLRALELLAKFKGMIVDRTENKNLNIETALADLK